METFPLKYFVLSKRGKVKKKLYIWYNFIIIIQDMELRPEREEMKKMAVEIDILKDFSKIWDVKEGLREIKLLGKAF